MILGTAGHIDHGKTALVRALTGVETTHLPEERRRGITIELGFAPLQLPGLGTIGVVDVPGHEGFVRTMLAGATGVDLALLVVAADEGVMPQTREHVAILSLLGIRGGVVALTKRDLVDEEWLALVADDVRALVAGTPLGDAAIVPVSSRTGGGIPELREALTSALRALPARSGADVFRMPVDRAFTLRGTGTVVTGTVWSGAVGPDDVVRIVPDPGGGVRLARVRGVHAHGARVARAVPGTRSAIALAGVELADVARGCTLVGGAQAGWMQAVTLRADVALLEDAPAVGARTRLRLHLGTADMGARIVTGGLGGAGRLEPGERKAARIVLDAPVVARGGDRFVLRGGSPPVTIGGGIVTDPSPRRRRARLWPLGVGAAERLALMAEESGGEGVAREELAIRLGVPPQGVSAVESADAAGAIGLGDRLFSRRLATELEAQLAAAVADHHARAPLDPGMSLQAVRSRLAARDELVDEVLRRAVANRRVLVEGGVARLAGWSITLSPGQERLRERIAARLEDGGREPPSLAELEAEHGPEVPAVLRVLEREGRAVLVERDRYYSPGAVTQLTAELRRRLQDGGEHSPAELRDVLGVSRKYLIPLLEFFDRTGVTERVSGGRRRAGTQFATGDNHRA